MSFWEHARDVALRRVPLGTSRGWLPDLPDHRDKMFHRHFWSGLPAGDVDLRDQETPVVDQGILGSCVPCSLAAMMSMVVKPRIVGTIAFSPLFLYYEARRMLGKTDEDTGVDFRTALKVMKNVGVCIESQWPYEPNRFAWKPSKQCYERTSYKIDAYYRMRDVKDAWTCLEDGFPFAMGMTLYKELYAAGVSGILADPDASSKPLGSHAILVVGHDRDHGTFLCRNSFGADWGINGHFWMPHYLADWRNAWAAR